MVRNSIAGCYIKPASKEAKPKWRLVAETSKQINCFGIINSPDLFFSEQQQ